MKKIKLTERDLKRIIKESVRRALLKEDDDYTIQYAVDKCANIIASTQCAGRNFDFKGKSTLDGDEEPHQREGRQMSQQRIYAVLVNTKHNPQNKSTNENNHRWIFLI